MQNLAIIIPCFNEKARWQHQEIATLLHQLPHCHLFLVDDGSTDGTAEFLKASYFNHANRITIIQQPINIGKASSIRNAVMAIQSSDFDFIAFTDADFSAPASELIRLYQLLLTNDKQFIIGSRIKQLHAQIKRSEWRHYIGRIITSIIDWHVKLGIYDTQCGLKIFNANIASVIFEAPLKTNWLFDVELLSRIRQKGWLLKGCEAPLLAWTDVKGSKLNFTHIFSILKEISLIYKYY